MAQYDMPAFIDFVLNKTGQPSLSLIGHSQGTMMNFALFSQRPDMEKKVSKIRFERKINYKSFLGAHIKVS